MGLAIIAGVVLFLAVLSVFVMSVARVIRIIREESE